MVDLILRTCFKAIIALVMTLGTTSRGIVLRIAWKLDVTGYGDLMQNIKEEQRIVKSLSFAVLGNH